MSRIGICVVCGLLVLVASGTASAQGGLYRGHVTGHVGSTFGGDAAGAGLSGGASMSVQEDSGWGAEVDFGIANDTSGGTREADLTTVMVNMNWIRPSGPLHPFVMIGVGTIGVRGCLLPCSTVTTTWDFGLGAGGGARYDLNDLVAIGGDVRYFMAPGSHTGTSRPENFGFFRAAVGVTLSWAIVP
jgi:opacity protein-like surface antigen